jgi:hypothetical protein
MSLQISTNRYLTQAEYDDPGKRAEVKHEIEECLRDTGLKEGEFFAGDVHYSMRMVPREQAAFTGELCLSGELDVLTEGDVIEPGPRPGEIYEAEEVR